MYNYSKKNKQTIICKVNKLKAFSNLIEHLNNIFILSKKQGLI